MASRDYKSLLTIFNVNENKTKVKYLMGMLLLPLQSERKVRLALFVNRLL